MLSEERIRAMVLAREFGHRVHVGCGGEVDRDCLCHGCGRRVPSMNTVAPTTAVSELELGSALLDLLDQARKERDEARRLLGRPLAAWVIDRAEQYTNGSGIRAAIEELAERIRRAEHVDSILSGGVDDVAARLVGPFETIEQWREESER